MGSWRLFAEHFRLNPNPNTVQVVFFAFNSINFQWMKSQFARRKKKTFSMTFVVQKMCFDLFNFSFMCTSPLLEVFFTAECGHLATCLWLLLEFSAFVGDVGYWISGYTFFTVFTVHLKCVVNHFFLSATCIFSRCCSSDKNCVMFACEALERDLILAT